MAGSSGGIDQTTTADHDTAEVRRRLIEDISAVYAHFYYDNSNTRPIGVRASRLDMTVTGRKGYDAAVARETEASR